MISRHFRDKDDEYFNFNITLTVEYNIPTSIATAKPFSKPPIYLRHSDRLPPPRAYRAFLSLGAQFSDFASITHVAKPDETPFSVPIFKSSLLIYGTT